MNYFIRLMYMSLYISYVVGSSVALYLGKRIFGGGTSESNIVGADADSENKYIVKDNGEELEVTSVLEEKVGEISEGGIKLYKCSRCDTMLKESLYSKSQRKRLVSLWKCKICAKLR
mgnify:CR=1 FL=1